MKNLLKSLGLILLILACSPNDKSSQIEEMYSPGTDTDGTNGDYLREEIEDIFLGNTTPCDIPFMLEQTKVDFDSELINSLETPPAASFTDFELAMNLGVYTTDFGYLASFGRHDDALIYLNHCQEMARELGVTTAFDMELIRDVENKIESPNALSRVIRNEMHEITKYLKGDFRNEPAVLVTAGGLVEGLYISAELLSRNYKADESCIPSILEVIHSQEESFKRVYLLLETLNTAETFDPYLVDFKITLESLVNLDADNNDLDNNQSWQIFISNIRGLREQIIVKEDFLL